MSTPDNVGEVTALPFYSYTADEATFTLLLAMLAELPYKKAKPLIDGMLGQLKQQELDAAAAVAAAAAVEAQTAKEQQALSDANQQQAQSQATQEVSSDSIPPAPQS